MNTDQHRLKHQDLTEKIIGIFYEVYNELGYGFLESVYENAMALALQQAGLTVHKQFSVPVWSRGQQVGDFRGDLAVDDRVILEFKAARTIERAHEAQLLNYLRATPLEIGLLLNFG